MANDISLQGLSPQERYLWNAQAKWNAEDILIVVQISNVTPEPTAAAWSYTVPFTMETAAGEQIPYTGNIVAGAGDTSTAGTASVSDSSPAMVMGAGSVNLVGDEAAWLDTETATLTLTYTTPYGNDKTDTFVVTFTA